MPTDPRRAILWLIGGTLALRLLWAATLEPSNDEAYHWLYTVHPDWSFFDHPPMTMLVAKAGLTLCGGWVHPLSLRLGFVLLFAGSTWILYRWTARHFGGWAGVYAAVGLNLSLYHTAAAGAFALPDSPFLFFALFTYWRASVALERTGAFGRAGGVSPLFPQSEDKQGADAPRSPGKELADWLLVGVGFAGAMLSKYHAVFLPAGVVAYVLLTPGTRRVLLSPGPYLAVLLGAVGFVPVVLWNAENGWASFKFQGGRAVGLAFRPAGVVAWLFGPVLYLLPGVWFALAREGAPRLWRFNRTAGAERLVVCLAAVPLAFFLAVSCVRWVLLHWNLIGFIPLFVLAGKRWAEWAAENPKRAALGLRFMAASVLLILAAIWGHAHFGRFRPPGKDPTDDIAGWKDVAAKLDARGLLADPTQFLFTHRWYDSGQLAFAVRNRLPVACYNSLDARGFAFWSRPDDWLGKTGYLVFVTNPDDPRSTEHPTEPAEADALLAEMREFFTAVSVAAEFPMERNGRPWREVRVYRCANQLRPYPFTYTGRK